MADVFKIGASSIAGGGGVGGASNLTTVGAVPYVSASGVLNQDGSFLRVSTGQYTLYDPTATTGSTLATITPVPRKHPLPPYWLWVELSSLAGLTLLEPGPPC